MLSKAGNTERAYRPRRIYCTLIENRENCRKKIDPRPDFARKIFSSLYMREFTDVNPEMDSILLQLQLFLNLNLDLNP